jgi:hypothetical protein
MADKITIKADKLVIETDEGKKVERDAKILDEMYRQEFQPLSDGVANPDGTKFIEHQGPLMIVVHQQPAHVRQLRWIAPDSPRPYGSGVKYNKVRLSFPYTITLASFLRQPNNSYAITSRNELYFSNVPVVNKNTVLHYPALLNVSVMQYGGGRSSTWICTQYLGAKGTDHWTETLEKLLQHTWNGAFNLSSEHHEGASWYGSYSNNKKLTPVANWQEATSKDDAFGLKIEWTPAGTVGDIVQAMLKDSGVSAVNQSVVNRIVKYAKV